MLASGIDSRNSRDRRVRRAGARQKQFSDDLQTMIVALDVKGEEVVTLGGVGKSTCKYPEALAAGDGFGGVKSFIPMWPGWDLSGINSLHGSNPHAADQTDSFVLWRSEHN